MFMKETLLKMMLAYELLRSDVSSVYLLRTKSEVTYTLQCTFNVSIQYYVSSYAYLLSRDYKIENTKQLKKIPLNA